MNSFKKKWFGNSRPVHRIAFAQTGVGVSGFIHTRGKVIRKQPGAAGARRDHGVAAVQARDLSDQSETEPGSRRVRAEPVEL